MYFGEEKINNLNNDGSSSFKKDVKEEGIFTDSLAEYEKNGKIKSSQIALVRELLKQRDINKIKELKESTITHLIKDSNMGVRRLMAFSLKFYKDKEKATFLLLDSLKSEKKWIVKEEIINSLGEIGLSFEKGNQIREEIELTLVSYLLDIRHPVREAAIKAITKLNVKEAIEKLGQISLSDPVLSLRKRAQQAIDKIQNSK